MRRWRFLLVLVGSCVLLAGCATTNQDEDVSTIPWNRPQSWEGQGAMGGFKPPGSN
jgi:hypothetical protein